MPRRLRQPTERVAVFRMRVQPYPVVLWGAGGGDAVHPTVRARGLDSNNEPTPELPETFGDLILSAGAMRS
jgi:hypothetical protein